MLLPRLEVQGEFFFSLPVSGTNGAGLARIANSVFSEIVHWLIIGNPSCLCSDAFQRRERASEDYAIRQREKEKLLELKKKLTEQQQHLERLSQHM